MYFDATGLPWVLPSPNIPTLDTAVVYPGARAVRGDAAVGRARHEPAVRVHRRAVDRRRALRGGDERARDLPGVRFRPVFFEPTYHKHAQTPCGGCQIHVTDRAGLRADARRRSRCSTSSSARRRARRCGATRPTSTSTSSRRSTSSTDRIGCGTAIDAGEPAGVDHEGLGPRRRRVPDAAGEVPALLMTDDR